MRKSAERARNIDTPYDSFIVRSVFACIIRFPVRVSARSQLNNIENQKGDSTILVFYLFFSHALLLWIAKLVVMQDVRMEYNIPLDSPILPYTQSKHVKIFLNINEREISYSQCKLEELKTRVPAICRASQL